MWRIQIQQEPAGNYHSVADCRNKANKSLQKNVTCVASMYYLVHTSVQFTDPKEPRWGQGVRGGNCAPRPPYFGRFRCEACSIKWLILLLPLLSGYQTFHRLWLHSSLHSVHMYTCRESMDRTKIFVGQRRRTTLKMKRLNFITLLPPCLSQSLAVGCSTSFLTKENWKLGVL